jgi:hypothetical protein
MVLMRENTSKNPWLVKYTRTSFTARPDLNGTSSNWNKISQDEIDRGKLSILPLLSEFHRETVISDVASTNSHLASFHSGEVRNITYIDRAPKFLKPVTWSNILMTIPSGGFSAQITAPCATYGELLMTLDNSFSQAIYK